MESLLCCESYKAAPKKLVAHAWYIALVSFPLLLFCVSNAIRTTKAGIHVTNVCALCGCI